MTDFAQLARDTLTASEKATPGPWKRDGGALLAPGHGWIFNGGISPHCTTGNGLNDAEFIALMRTVGPLLAQHVLDLREALAFYADKNNWTQPTSYGTRIYDEDAPAPSDFGRVARAARAEKEQSDE